MAVSADGSILVVRAVALLRLRRAHPPTVSRRQPSAASMVPLSIAAMNAA